MFYYKKWELKNHAVTANVNGLHLNSVDNLLKSRWKVVENIIFLSNLFYQIFQLGILIFQHGITVFQHGVSVFRHGTLKRKSLFLQNCVI